MKYLALLALLGFFLIPDTMDFDRVAWARENGCPWRLCPQEWIEEMVESEGSLPPGAYPYLSKDWWRAYCNYATQPKTCTYE